VDVLADGGHASYIYESAELMTSDLLSQLLRSARRHLDALLQGDNGYKHGSVNGLMTVAYRLGQALSADPGFCTDAAVRQFMDETASVLKARQVDLTYYPATLMLEFRGNWETNEWEQLCAARSGIQFFIDLFRDTALSDEVGSIDVGDIDEFIRERGTDEGYSADEEIPSEIPASHWWWWFPQPPRRR
jgi:hypothetical protein